MEQIIRNPKSIKELAFEINRVCDAYWGREMTEKEAREYITYWKTNESKKLLKGTQVNPTVKKIIGKKREELISKWLKELKVKE